jgi:16S rRNA (guanine527-N7)-methyltransferase
VKELLSSWFDSWGISADQTAIERFETYARLLGERGKDMNLVADTDSSEIAVRHFLDSAVLVRMGIRKDAAAIDIGTGAGFPGMPVKILMPSLKMTLMDSLGKRLEFLNEVKEKLALNDLTIVNARAEEAALMEKYRDRYDYVFSRAVARMNILCEICMPFAAIGGLFCAMKTQRSEEEEAEAEKAIRYMGGRKGRSFDYELPGKDNKLRILQIEKVSPTPKGYPRRFAKIKQKPL